MATPQTHPVYFKHRIAESPTTSTPQFSYAQTRTACSTPVLDSWEEQRFWESVTSDSREKTVKGSKSAFSKKLLSFPWGRSDKKASSSSSSATPSTTPATRDISAPISAPKSILIKPTSPLSPQFAAPSSQPPRAGPAPKKPLPSYPGHSLEHGQAPTPHATSFIAPRNVQNSQSESSMNSHPSSSSFASTNLFSDEDSTSDATTMTSSSPENSPRHRRNTSGDSLQQRMWKVKGLADSGLRSSLSYGTEGRSSDEDVEEVIARSRTPSRNSTPVPSMVAAMLKDPETPPRVKRLSASSKPAPDSPPFDPLLHRIRNPSTESPESAEDADDEVSPRKQRQFRKRESFAYEQLFPADQVYSTKNRLPSIRFEGISMDAVFSEVEKKMKSGGESSGSSMTKAERRRTRVLSMYRPEIASEPATPSPRSSTFPIGITSGSKDSIISIAAPTPTLTSSAAVAETTCPETVVEAAVPRLRNLPRRVSSRPSPLNVEAANAYSRILATHSPTIEIQSPPLVAITSPTTPISPALSTRTISAGPQKALSPDLGLTSPPQSGLGEAFSPTSPSPALSSTSTFCGFDLPEVCVRPPTPEANEGDWERPVQQLQASGPTKVVVLEPKRRIKISSRASTSFRRPTRLPTIVTPPLSPTPSSPSDVASSPGLPGDIVGLFPGVDYKHASLALSSGSSGESDVEDALNNMLFQLNRPHTPPSADLPVTPTSPSSLTIQALALHTSGVEKENLIDRTTRPASVPTSVYGGEASASSDEDVVAVPTTPRTSTSSSHSASVVSLDELSLGEESESNEEEVENGRPFSFSTDSETDGESSIDGGEVGVVMMGERVSCGNYIGMAM